MDRLSLLRKYQGDRTNREYAKLLGVHESYLSKCYSGEQPVGMKALDGLARAFPEAREDIVKVLGRPAEPAEVVAP